MTVLHASGKRQMVKDRVIAWIRDHGLTAGAPIPSQNVLAAELGTTAVTVHKALTELVAEGVIYRTRGSGSFVGRDPALHRTRSLCLVMPGEHLDQPEYNPEYWPYVQTLLRAFLEAAGQQWTFTTWSLAAAADPAAVARQLGRHDVTFFHYAQRPVPLMQALIRARTSTVVSLGLPEPGVNCFYIDHDRVAGGALAARHLLALGYRRPVFVGSPEYWGRLSREGFAGALAEAGMPLPPERIVLTGERPAEVALAVGQYLRTATAGDAIFADSDLKAMGVLTALHERGLDAPRDVGLISYDGVDIYTQHAPYLTAVRIPYRRILEHALGECARGTVQPGQLRLEQLPGEVIAGRTCHVASLAPAN